MEEKIAIIEGVRTPMGKAGGILRDFTADELGALALREGLRRSGLSGDEVDEVIIGNVAQPINAANVSRVIALKGGLGVGVSAVTVHRNCASGMEAITSGAERLLSGRGELIVVGGTESMTNIPLIYNRKMTSIFERLFREKRLWGKLKVVSGIRGGHFKPVIGLVEGLTDPICGMMMGRTAEELARFFKITREEQDKYALSSHKRAVRAIEKGILAEEIVPLADSRDYKRILTTDEGPRSEQSLEALGKLRPYFDRLNGTVTVGNSCPVTDGACVLLLMRASLAKRRKLEPLGYLREYAYASLAPERMGLGPAYATAKLLERTGGKLSDFDLIELNEAFAAQVIANEKAFGSRSFCKEYLGRSKALGTLKRGRLNVNGGAIALGHPVGMTGARLVLHLLKELRRRRKNRGLATVCVGGGQGAALDLEVSA